MYIKSELPEEPKLKIRMWVDVMAYRSHKPYVQLSLRDDWYANLGPSKQQKDVVLKTSIADTCAQCFLLGSNHLHGLGLDVSSLLQSEINLNCANSTAAGNLGVFFAKARGEHHETEEEVESRTMVYVIEGNIILVSKAILETLGCIPKTFPLMMTMLLLEELSQSTQIPSDLCQMVPRIPTYLRLLLQLVTSPNMLTPAPMQLWPVRPARWLGQDLAHHRWLG